MFFLDTERINAALQHQCAAAELDADLPHPSRTLKNTDIARTLGLVPLPCASTCMLAQ